MSELTWRNRPRKPRPDLAERNRASAKHGMTGTPTHKSWCAMRDRCLSVTNKDYPNYGGRGIDIDPRWDSFETFLADMGERPPRTSLGRIDNDKGYSPGNCRWETNRQQSNNKRVSRFIEHDGRRMTIAQWAVELGTSRQTIRHRLEAGWPDAQIVTAAIDPSESMRLSWRSGRRGQQ